MPDPKTLTKLTRALLASASLGGGALVGCGPPEDGLEQRQGPLTGTVAFIAENPCTADQETLIRNAVARGVAQITQGDSDHSSLLDVCLRNSIISELSSYSAEDIRAAVKQWPTAVSCKDIAPSSAQAALGVAPEQIDFDRAYLNNLITNFGPNSEAAIADVTGVLLHEVAHSHGYEHHDTRRDPGATGKTDYQTTVPEQIRACSLKLSQGSAPNGNGVSRDAFLSEARLAKVGTKITKVFDEIYCSSTRLANAFNVRFGVNTLQNFSLRCQKPGSTDSNSAWAGSDTSGTASTLACPSGQVAVGAAFHERAGVITKVQIVCNPESNVVAQQRFWTPTAAAGLPDDPSDVVIARQCPVGMAIKGFKGRWGSGPQLSELELVCQFVGSNRAFVNVPVNTNLALAGVTVSSDRRTSIERCAGKGALQGLTYNTSSTYVRRMGGLCGEVGTFCSNGTCRELLTLPQNYAMTSHGSWDGTYSEDKCAANQVLVGFNFITDSIGVVAVQGVCAPIGDWSLGVTSGTSTLPRKGGTTGTSVSRMCPAGALLVGWQLEHKDAKVRGIVPKCRTF
jgi:hypothetical protein